jgi:hypothetical protein
MLLRNESRRSKLDVIVPVPVFEELSTCTWHDQRICGEVFRRSSAMNLPLISGKGLWCTRALELSYRRRQHDLHMSRVVCRASATAFASGCRCKAASTPRHERVPQIGLQLYQALIIAARCTSSPR